jgi:subtilase family serine protease
LERNVLNIFQDRQLLEKPVKMLKSKPLTGCFLAIAMILHGGIFPVLGADLKVLHGHVPHVISSLAPKGRLAATLELRLAIGLPLRDPAGLENFLAQLYDPANPNFRRFLTPEEFTARFGPTEEDYEAAKNFARTNGLTVAATYNNRLVLDVAGPVAAVEKAFHVALHSYRHPTEARDFFAPDTEPTVDAALPVADVQGLSDYWRPQPMLIKENTVNVPNNGSAPDGSGSLFGNDFRNAYMPGTALTGAGQMVGLLEFDGYYPSDIAAYATAAGDGRTGIVTEMVLLDGYNGVPTTAGNEEVSLDIEMAMAMAPGLSKIVVFSAGPDGFENDILDAMAASNTVNNLSCCWSWGGGPSATTDNIFRQMGAQGQSFFNASGDSDAFTTGANSINGVDNPSLAGAPSSSPYITQVGGTTLTMNGSGASYASETVWNWGVELGSSYDGMGSSGGISSYYTIPYWQTNVSMAVNHGSTTKRNIPDVAMNADNVFVDFGNGSSDTVGGTSCATPLWAGLTALANQMAASDGRPEIGFINPTIYLIGGSPDYALDFHDIATGNNTWSGSTSQFYAVKGYDLCTGWGTPTGENFIADLVAQGDSLEILSGLTPAAIGVAGGPFNSPASVIVLTNSGVAPLTWKLLNPNAATWLKISPVSGELDPQTTTNVTLNFTAAVNNLAAGNHRVSLEFSNLTSTTEQLVDFQLQALPVLSVLPTNGFTATGPVGGAFTPAAQDFTISNLGVTSAVWKAVASSAWLAVNPSTGTVAAVSQTNFTVSLTAHGNTFGAGNYKATVTVRNSKGQMVQKLPFTLSIGQNIVSNGGFETGNFNGWDLNATSTQVGSLGGLVYSGHYGAELGQPTNATGYLSQTLPTTAGQTYLLSLWLRNPQNSYGATPNEFLVQWDGNTIYDVFNLPFGPWTNLQFVVTATNSSSLLQFAFEDGPYYLGLDDINVKPVAAPKVEVITRAPASFNFTFAVRARASYQVQYKTNLMQPDWIDMGANILAETNSLKFADTNVVNCPQKFYRLIPAP